MIKEVAVIGGGVAAAQAAVTLAEMGLEVKVMAPAVALGWGEITGDGTIAGADDILKAWPILVKAATHPRIVLHTNTEVTAITGRRGKLTVKAVRKPRFVREDVCAACGRCEEVCSVRVPLLSEGRMVAHSAIHAPVLHAKTAPSAYYIEKSGIAPCRAACPLGINVQGFVSLLSRGKLDEALSVITEASPLPAVLGRVCTHPCEDECRRVEVDSAVFIKALHRYAADNAPGGIKYRFKSPIASRREKVAIIGSGPAGLAAAWELARRGYRATIFEMHAVVGGMLATGIPRFRLPREVREREIEAIRALGVDIKTGVAVGRDVTISDLRDREYRAFFLAIGANQNNRLNIPGEELEGVVDGMSLLFALNVKVGTSVGSNVVVIGGGNSAVDAARIANRRSRGKVRILCIWKRMTAIKEDVEEAIKEGVTIDYETAPVAILGDGVRVTGVQCQRTRAVDEEGNGLSWPEIVPGSDFVIETDHVVVAIGQRPNTSQLSMRSLDVDMNSGTIKTDPLTLETSVPGVFAGGDCVTGSNNVVSAVAAGLRAAESIDRYLRGRDLVKGRTLEGPHPAQLDVRGRDALYYKRARMPEVPVSRRMGNFEETALGLPQEMAEREAGRCLNCALCSECKECERVCELNAVFHGDSAQRLEIAADLVIDIRSGEDDVGYHRHGGGSTRPKQQRRGVMVVEIAEEADIEARLVRATAAALEAAVALQVREAPAEGTLPIAEGGGKECPEIQEVSVGQRPRQRGIGVVLCRCGGSISSIIDFKWLTNAVLQLQDVLNVAEISQACTEEGASKIATLIDEWNLDRVVLAACRCCGLEQICYSCSDRRVKCQQVLNKILGAGRGRLVEFVNIREQCAWVHGEDPAGATNKAIDIITSGVVSALRLIEKKRESVPVADGVLVLGAGLCGLTAASKLKSQGYRVAIVSAPRRHRERRSGAYVESRDGVVKELEESGVRIASWSDLVDIGGTAGSYRVFLRERSGGNECVEVGAVLVNLGQQGGELDLGSSTVIGDNLVARILNDQWRRHGGAMTAVVHDRVWSVRDSGGIFIVATEAGEPVGEQMLKGSALAARASVYLAPGVIRPQANAVTINDKLCRGCGDCAAICPYIEMREHENGTIRAYVDPVVCMGCGACIGCCPTGAITQSPQGDRDLIGRLEALLGGTGVAVGWR